MAVVETRNVTKVFKEGELGAVNDVNLVTQEGEFLVFLGPSGSGKTTLLRMIAGLEEPTAGEIFIGSQMVNNLSPRERGIAMVFQSYALYPHLSVYKNIAFPLKAQKVPKEKHREKVEWASRGRWRARTLSNDANGANSTAAEVSAESWRAPSDTSQRFLCSTKRCQLSMPK